MAKNKITALHNHLFAQLERLNDEDLTAEEVQKETIRAKAITGIASQIIKSNKVVVDAMRLVASGDYTVKELPTMIGMEQ